MKFAERHQSLNDLEAAQWVQAFDAAWLNRDWSLLEGYLALDVEFRSRDSGTALVGRAAVLGSIREFLDSVRVHEYNATDLRGHSFGMLGVIRYRWQFDWTRGGEHRCCNGRDVLVLRRVGERWELRTRVRRTLDLAVVVLS